MKRTKHKGHGPRSITGPELVQAERSVANFKPDERVGGYPFLNLGESIESHSEILPALLREFQSILIQAREAYKTDSPENQAAISKLFFNFCRGTYESGIIIGTRIADNRHSTEPERPQ